jgi:zinc/manganese transport system substrate-binding protein
MRSSIRPVLALFRSISLGFVAALTASLVSGLAAAPAARAEAGPVKLVAAENFYGAIAHRIGGLQVTVTSILNNPEQDPHLFEASPAVARQLADARIVVVNGADYDPWMAKLLKASPRPGRIVINVAALTGHKAGDNPHLWYDPATMPKVAQALAAALSKADPAHAPNYSARLKETLASLARIEKRVAALRAKFRGAPVTATEPVFGYMAAAAGLTMRNEAFQTAVMNDTEPSARDLAAFESDLKQHKVRALIYNKQVTEKLTQRLIDIARKANVPVVPVTETMPAGVSFGDWMLGELDALDKALSGPPA